MTPLRPAAPWVTLESKYAPVRDVAELISGFVFSSDTVTVLATKMEQLAVRR
jgi:hypothetical protein